MNSNFFNLVFKKIKNNILGEFPKISYSRSGEDLLLDEIFNFKFNGCYVDVGAFHPIDYSNTYKFYLKGWRGINIEPNKEVIDLFNKMRPGDVNLNMAVGSIDGSKTYYMNKADPSMNTISEEFLKESIINYGITVSEKRIVEVRRLDNILKTSEKKIDLLNIDTEGYDLEVIKSNDWRLYRPKIVCIELNCSVIEAAKSDIYLFLEKNGYSLFSYTYLNAEVGNGFFIANEQK